MHRARARSCELDFRPPRCRGFEPDAGARLLCAQSRENVDISQGSPKAPSAARSPRMRTPLSAVRSPIDEHLARYVDTARQPDEVGSEVGSSSMDSAATCEDPRLVIALLRLMTSQARGLSAVRENSVLATRQLTELSASLAEVKCALASNEVGWPWGDTESILHALAITESQLDRALCSEVAACSPPRPSSGRRAVGPESPSPRCRNSPSALQRATFPGAEPAAAADIRMRLFRISHRLDRLGRFVSGARA